MFKAIENGKIVGINETGEFPLMNYESLEEDTEHQVADYIHCDGQFVLTVSDEAIEQRKEQVRSVRNQYLKQTDKYMITDYPISDEERELYKQYREYLRDYTLTENWWEHSPKDFSTWKEMLTEEEWNEPKEPDPSGTQEEAGI